MEKQELEEGKTFAIFECSVPHTSSYVTDEMKLKLTDPRNHDYIPESMPNIREIYVEAEKTDNRGNNNPAAQPHNTEIKRAIQVSMQ